MHRWKLQTVIINASVRAYDNLINFSSSRMKGSFIGEKIKILAIAGMKSPNELLNMSNQTESLFPGLLCKT